MGNNTYIADTTNSIIINKEITIRGGLKLDDGKYSILDGRGMTTIFKLHSSYNVVFDSIIFLNGFSNENGGAVLLDKHSSITIEFRNCQFINNIAHKGGAIYAEWYTTSYSGSTLVKLNIINSTFINNNAINGEGGAIYDGNWYQTTIVNSNFINNTATTKGGAVYSKHGTPTYTSSNFINNSATDEGGAIYTSQNYFDISYCSFMNNYANYGGAYYSYRSYGSTNNDQAQIRSSNFTNNKAHFKGGAVMWNVLSGQIIDSQFTNNSADGEGGAIYVQPVNNVYSPYTFKIINSRFIENSASFGGAVYVRGIYYTTHGSVSAPSSTNNRYYERTEILSSHFISNTANKGGAIYDSGLKTYISSNQFTNNNASEDDSNALFMTIDDQFEYEPFKTSARYYTGFDKRLSGNIINGEKTEIVLDKSTFGLVNLKILDINSQSYSKEVTYYDGKVRLYATLKT